MRFALVSHILPPSPLGQAAVIYRMLSGLRTDSYCLISSEPGPAGTPGENHTGTLPGNYHQLPPTFKLTRGHRFGLSRFRENGNMLLPIVQHARSIARIIKKEKCDAVVACTGDVMLPPAGYLASRWRRVPFYLYVFDHYSYRECQPLAASWARRFEPWLMKGAAAVITPNEILKNDLYESYGTNATVIHNSFDLSPYQDDGHAPSSAVDGEFKIVYTGEVYEAHYDAFRNLIGAMELLNRPDVKLHLYTNRKMEDLEALGIQGPIVYHESRAAAEMPEIQMQADVLFLPLAFNSPYPNLVKTSSTTKLGEYLGARRPVLVHAPPGSFVSWYFQRHKCGVVVDQNDPAKLADGLQLILSDAKLRQTLSLNAWERARTDFNLNTSRAAFAKLLELEP